MKRLFQSLAVAAIVAGPLMAAAPSAHAQSRGEREERWERRESREERWERREERYGSWDRGRHNGYYYNNRWFYGPPPEAYQGSPYYRPGYSAWRRGSSLPPYYRGNVVRDYDRHHLRRPPAGYAWYQIGDDYLLAGIASGIIFDIIGED